jgi:hypothetical protein
MIGEHFSHISNRVCGSVISVRRSGVKLALWLSTRDRSEVEEIGRSFKSVVLPLVHPKDESSFVIAFDYFGNDVDQLKPIEL